MNRVALLRFITWAALALSLTTAAQAAQARPALTWIPGPGGDLSHATCEVSGLDKRELSDFTNGDRTAQEWGRVFAVTVERSDVERTQPPTPIVGTYAVRDDIVRFTPRYPLVAGLTYMAEWSGVGKGDTSKDAVLRARITIPRAPTANTTEVVRIDPAIDTLPENQLKLYVHFSAPMQRGEAYEHIRLEDLGGEPIDLPFLEIGEELWDRTTQRLTLLFDPGRIKRGLKPREELGPILTEGHRYCLTIDSAWPDARGNTLAASHKFLFRAGPPDEEPPDPATWKLTVPGAGSRDPLTVEFGESLDRAMLDRALRVMEPGDSPLEGMHTITIDGRSWQFTPKAPWAVGNFSVAIDTALEDLAGNSIGRPFEVDAVRTIERRIATDTYTLNFRILAKLKSSGTQ